MRWTRGASFFADCVAAEDFTYENPLATSALQGFSSTVHLVVATDPHHEHPQYVVFDAGDHTVIAYPLLPKLAEPGTLDWHSEPHRAVATYMAVWKNGLNAQIVHRRPPAADRAAQ